MKYQNLMELAVAFKEGKLKGYTLMLDNDFSSLRYTGSIPEGLNEEEQEAFTDRKTDEASDLYRGNGYVDIDDACEAAGIPAEWG